ncbi:hypothetical protein OG271_10690 [Micromonospora rifamycinica]|uniref:hypothetical protein n=1 Tax=Micromonospora rifamycinica TaxID=291594 RepID=UPI002E2E6652|nr:hypothetical protein [Micromonospora rifamycinica]
MSSGGIVILPVAVVAAAGAAVVLTAAGTAVLLVNAAGAAAEGALRAVGDYGERLEAELGALAEAEAKAARWQCVAADVVGLNARIRLLERRAAGGGPDLDVPPPVALSGGTIDQVRQRMRETEQALLAAQRELDAAVAQRELAALVAALPPAAATPDTITAVRAYREALARRRAPAERPEPVDSRRAGQQVEGVLAGLDPDANADERAAALAGAALVAAHPTESASYLRALRGTVRDLNARVARRRLAAQWLTTLEDRDVAVALVHNGPPAPLRGTAARLRAVVDGDAELTPQLRREGTELVTWAGEMVRQRFTRDLVLRLLREEGYTVDAEVDTRHTAGLRVSRADWHGEHTADVWVDEAGTIHGRVLRELTAAGDEAELRDRSRCDEFADHLAVLADRIDTGTGTAEVSVQRGHRPEHRQRDAAAFDTSTARSTAAENRTREAGR